MTAIRLRVAYLHQGHALQPGTTYEVAADVAAGLCGLELADEAAGPADTTLDGLTWPHPVSPRAIVEALGLQQVTDTGIIEKAVMEIMAANPDKVEQAKAKPTLIAWFVGQVMKATDGKANPQAVNDILNKNLGSLRSPNDAATETIILPHSMEHPQDDNAG